MNRANISYTRNHLSERLDRVRAGETIVIVDRRQPVARLGPAVENSSDGAEWQAGLVRRGLMRPARRRLAAARLAALPLPVPSAGGDILTALLAEREDGR
jgi:antitoxin (DNA-binding transcriptional repressor) of toxin-antitoxin stability system